MLITSSGEGSLLSGSISSTGVEFDESGVEITNAAMDVHSESIAGSLTVVFVMVRTSLEVPTLCLLK